MASYDDEVGPRDVEPLHSDHLFDLFNLLWMSPGDLPGPVRIIGPGAAGGLPSGCAPLVAPDQPTPGTRDMISGLIAAYAYDINIRNGEVGDAPSPSRLFDARDVVLPSHVKDGPKNTAPVLEPFVVHEDDRVKVSAALVPHGPIFACFAYRFDTDDGSVTFSGDTARSDNVSRLAAGTSLLVHEAAEFDWFLTSGIADRFGQGFLTHMEAANTSPADVGRIATDAGVPRVALSHVGPGKPDVVPDEQWRQGVATVRGQRLRGSRPHAASRSS